MQRLCSSFYFEQRLCFRNIIMKTNLMDRYTMKQSIRIIYNPHNQIKICENSLPNSNITITYYIINCNTVYLLI